MIKSAFLKSPLELHFFCTAYDDMIPINVPFYSTATVISIEKTNTQTKKLAKDVNEVISKTGADL